MGPVLLSATGHPRVPSVITQDPATRPRRRRHCRHCRRGPGRCRQLRRRHRSADGGLLDREFFFLLSFSLVTSFPFLSLSLFPAFFPCVFKSLHLSPPLLFHSPPLLFLSPPLPSLCFRLFCPLSLSPPRPRSLAPVALFGTQLKKLKQASFWTVRKKKESRKGKKTRKKD